MAGQLCLGKTGKMMNQENLFDLIHSIEQLSNEHIVEFTSRYTYPIGVSSVLVLAELRESGSLRQSDLADMLNYTKGAVTHIATKLVSYELAERLYDEEDRRTVYLNITDKGVAALNEAQKIGESIFLDLFEGLSKEELHEYLRLQQKLLDGMKNRRLSGKNRKNKE